MKKKAIRFQYVDVPGMNCALIHDCQECRVMATLQGWPLLFKRKVYHYAFTDPGEDTEWICQGCHQPMRKL